MIAHGLPFDLGHAEPNPAKPYPTLPRIAVPAWPRHAVLTDPYPADPAVPVRAALDLTMPCHAEPILPCCALSSHGHSHDGVCTLLVAVGISSARSPGLMSFGSGGGSPSASSSVRISSSASPHRSNA